MPADELKSWAWIKYQKQQVARARRDGVPCSECGRPIDWEAPPRTRWSPSVDHIHPRSLGGPLIPPEGGARVLHFACNSRRGNGTRTVPKQVVTGREW